jgi:hypothetical protein
MNTYELILIARTLHVVSSVVWAGFVMLIGFWFVGPHVHGGPRESRWLRQGMVDRGAPIVAPAALVSVLSGLYLFRALHAGPSWHELILISGAFSAVLSFFVGALGSGPPERRLARIDSEQKGDHVGPAVQAEIARLERRVTISARVTALLLLWATTSMAIARYL